MKTAMKHGACGFVKQDAGSYLAEVFYYGDLYLGRAETSSKALLKAMERALATDIPF